ncbi:hypothetical protein Tsubulata_041607, partial [Turnera subulata]
MHVCMQALCFVLIRPVSKNTYRTVNRALAESRNCHLSMFGMHWHQSSWEWLLSW